MRGKITKQELHQKLIDELNTHSKFVVSATEPTEDLTDGLIWFNPIVEISKIYYNGKFNDFGSAGGGSGGTGNSEIVTEVSRSTLLGVSNTANINMPSFRKELGILEVIANGTRLYPEDYKISDDNKSIIRKVGNWNEHGGTTDFMFVFYASVNMARSATPFLKPILRESFYVADGSEAAIPIDIPEFDKTRHKLMVTYNGMTVKEGVHYSLNSTGLAIRIASKIEPLDEFQFRIIDFADPEYVIMLPDGSTVAPSNFVYDKIEMVVIDTSEPVINLREGLIWVNPASNVLKVYANGAFIELIASGSGGNSTSGENSYLGPDEPTGEYSLWYKTL